MESFFTVIIWIATLDYDEAVFLTKPLARTMLDRNLTSMGIACTKENWFHFPKRFYKSIIKHFSQPYREDEGFLHCLFKLREILYPVEKCDYSDLSDLKARMHGGLDKNGNRVTEDADPMKEGLFRQCMKEIDDYLGETNGCDEMKEIGRRRAAEGTDGRGACERRSSGCAT